MFLLVGTHAAIDGGSDTTPVNVETDIDFLLFHHGANNNLLRHSEKLRGSCAIKAAESNLSLMRGYASLRNA